MTDLFPLEATQPPQAQPEDTDEALNQRAIEVQLEAVAFDKFSAEERMTTNTRYYSYRRLEDLPPPGQVFYELAARMAGLSALSLLKAVNMLEIQVREWKRRERRRAAAAGNRRETDTEAGDDAASEEEPGSAEPH